MPLFDYLRCEKSYAPIFIDGHSLNLQSNDNLNRSLQEGYIPTSIFRYLMLKLRPPVR